MLPTTTVIHSSAVYQYHTIPVGFAVMELVHKELVHRYKLSSAIRWIGAQHVHQYCNPLTGELWRWIELPRDQSFHLGYIVAKEATLPITTPQ